MKCCFGEIKNGRMILNEAGKRVDSEWKKTPVIRKMVELDYYVIMPNHFHGIIIINGEENRNVVETHRDASLRVVKNNLSDIVRGFKGSVTKQLHSTGFKSFKWQPRFYDHIIRNDIDLHRIRTYIHNNPLKWELDEYYQKT